MIVASFTPRDRQRIIVSGLGQPFAASISAVYNDGSAFIIREAEGRIAVVRSNPHLGQWCIGRIPVEIEYAGKGFEELMKDAKMTLAARGIGPEEWRAL